MNTFFYASLFVLGTLFWSFASVIIYRIKSWEWWIMTWRSHCWSCKKILKSLDLIPIISYIINKWWCRHCKKKVSSIYPLLEISTWILFSLIWYFLIDFSLIFTWDLLEISKLIFFLIIGFITIIYTFYDILFLEIPESVLATWIWIILIVLSAQTLLSWVNIINPLSTWSELIPWIIAIILSFIIVWALYIIMLKWLKEIWDILILVVIVASLFAFKFFFWIKFCDFAILDWIIWALWIFIFFFTQIIISGWAWMWWGDLRIAILIWLILWISLSFPWIMITYMVWSVIWISLIIHSKIKHLKSSKATKLTTQIPFWPFLAIWFFITIFYQKEILDLIKMYF